MENNDNEVMHQGKSITQWVKDFKGEFTYDQLLKMAKSGCDLQKILMLGLDENETCSEGCKILPLDADEGLNEMDADVEAAALSESIKPNYVVHVKVLGINTAFSVNAEDEDDAEKQVKEQIKKLTNNTDPKVEIQKIQSMKTLNESFGDSIVTVKDFKRSLDKSLAQRDDDIIFRLVKGKIACTVFDMYSKGGTAVIDIIPLGKDHPMTVGEFASQLNRSVFDDNDKIMFRTVKDKMACSVIEIYSKGDVTVVDLAPAIANESSNWEDSINEEED